MLFFHLLDRAPLVEQSHDVLYQNLRRVPAVTVAVVVVEYDGDISPIQVMYSTESHSTCKMGRGCYFTE